MSFFIVRLSLFLSLPFPQSPSLAIPPHPSPFLGRFLSISLLHPTHYSHPSPSFVSHTSVPKLVPPLFFYPKKVRHSRLFLPLVDLLLCFVAVILCFLFCNKDIASSLMTERRSDRLFFWSTLAVGVLSQPMAVTLLPLMSSNSREKERQCKTRAFVFFLLTTPLPFLPSFPSPQK